MALRWLPLESNPDVMNQFLRDLGLPEPWGLSDILTLDLDAANMVPQPSLAVILLLPLSKEYNEFVEKQEMDLNEIEELLPFDVYYMKQTITNACGTVALIHAIANNLEDITLVPDSILEKFLDSSRELTPEERGRKLEENVDIANLHEAGANEGQTEAVSIDEDVDLHFIAFVNIKNRIVELDGRKSRPIVHCVTSRHNFLKDVFNVCQKYTSIDPYNLRCSALSLGLVEPLLEPICVE